MILIVLELYKFEIFHSDIKPENIIFKKINDINFKDNLI